MIKKIVTILRMTTFIATLLTTIPLFVNYLIGSQPKNQLIVHLHVWFGLGFLIFAIISMIIQKKNKATNGKS